MSSYDAALIDTATIESEALLSLPRGVRLLHIEALVWSKVHRTDGRIPTGALSRMSDEPEARAAADRLVHAGLWTMTDAGWLIVGFTDSQMSAQRVRQHQQAAAERYDRWRAKHPEHPKGKKSTNGVDNAAANEASRLPARLPAKQEQAGADGGGAGLEPAPAVPEIASVPSPNRRNLGRMIREAPNPSLRRAYVSIFKKTYGASYPDGRGHEILHRSMKTMVREGQVAA